MFVDRIKWKNRIVRRCTPLTNYRQNCALLTLRHVLPELKVRLVNYVFVSFISLSISLCSSQYIVISLIYSCLNEITFESFDWPLCVRVYVIAWCFVIIGGVTIRGCLSHRKKPSNGTDTCQFCRSNKCNSEIFPADRLSCLHCEGSSCVNQTNTVDVRYPCVNYELKDECYTIFSYGK